MFNTTEAQRIIAEKEAAETKGKLQEMEKAMNTEIELRTQLAVLEYKLKQEKKRKARDDNDDDRNHGHQRPRRN